MDLDEAADRLYGVAPAEFVAVRAELQRRARESGDAALARAVAGLRKPTVAAWAVNQVARDHPEELSGLLDVGERLRRAWQDRDAATLTELTARRSAVTGRLARLVRRTAEERGQALSGAALNEVEQTLDATIVDADAAERVRRGRLVRALSYSGFAPAPVTAVRPAGAPGTGGKAAGGGEAGGEADASVRTQARKKEDSRPGGTAAKPGKSRRPGKEPKAGAAAVSPMETAADEGAGRENVAATRSAEAQKPSGKAAARARAAQERRAVERERRRKARREAAETAVRAAAEAERDHAEWRAELDRAEEEYRRQAELVSDLESRLSEAREGLSAVERRLGVIRRDEGKARREAARLRRRADEARRALSE